MSNKILKFHRGFSTLDVATTRELMRAVKLAVKPIWPRLDKYIVLSLIKLNCHSFFTVIDFNYCITGCGETVSLGGSDTGKHTFTAVFKERDETSQLHWVLIRGVKGVLDENTIFYDTSSSDEQ